MPRPLKLILTALRTNAKARKALVAMLISLATLAGLTIDPQAADAVAEIGLTIAGALTDGE